MLPALVTLAVITAGLIAIAIIIASSMAERLQAVEDCFEQGSEVDCPARACACDLNLPLCDSRMCPTEPVSASLHIPRGIR